MFIIPFSFAVVRNAYSDPTNQYLIIIFTVLLFRIDFATATESFIIDYFFVSLAFRKCCDFLLKVSSDSSIDVCMYIYESVNYFP